jgi:RNA polymerase sigma-32 factor
MGGGLRDEVCERYRRDVSRFERISEEREAVLSRIIHRSRSVKKADQAISEMVESNLFLVMHCVHEFNSFLSSASVKLTRMDLVAEGNIALMTAARHYNVDYVSSRRKKVRFATYACGVIRNRMRRAIKMARLIHVPEQHFAYWSQMQRIKNHHGESLTEDIMMEELGVEKSKLRKLRESRQSDVSALEDLACREDGSAWSEILADERAASPFVEAELGDMNDYLQSELKKLPARTRAMVAAMYLSENGATLGDLSVRFGVSRERCRQVVAKGLQTLRKHIEGRNNGLTPPAAHRRVSVRPGRVVSLKTHAGCRSRRRTLQESAA